MPSVSIVVPIYNVEKYLKQCLDSIISQTLKDIEIILVNDGSKDGSLKIIKDYAARDNRIKVVDKANTGYGNSMNIGLSKATGKFIGIVESDDYIEPDMFETLYNLAVRDKLDVARSEFFYYTSKEEKNTPSKTDFVVHDRVYPPRDNVSVFYQQPSIWANLYSRSFLEKNRIEFLETPGASYQDTSFSFKVYASAKRFEMISKPLYHYRIDGGSSSFQKTTKVFCICDEYEEIWRWTIENKLYKEYCRLIPHLQLNGYKWNYNRLESPYDMRFFEKWSEEFKEIDSQGNLPLSDFSPEDQAIIGRILSGKPPVKNNQPLLTVVIPVYNVEKYLRKCLDSVVNQTFKRLKIICVNDGSTDSSLDILKEYASADPRIEIIDKKNGGQSSARNAGLQITKTDYVAFVDSDDWIEPDTYQMTMSHVEDSDIVLFGTNVVGDAIMDKRESDTEYYRVKYAGRQKLTDPIRLNMDVSVWNKIYRTDIINSINLRYPEGMLYEDYYFFWNYILRCEYAYFVTDKKYNYLRREGSTMARTFKKSKRAEEHLEIFIKTYRDINGSNGWKGHDDVLESMFLNCFWFAYINVPNSRKINVLKKGTDYAKEIKISGGSVISDLREKKYDQVDPDKSYSVKHRLASVAIRTVGNIFGVNTDEFKSLFSVNSPFPDDSSKNIATTAWIRTHENRYGIKRWNYVYDANSDYSGLNWGTPGGIKGGSAQTYDMARIHIEKGGEYRILITLWGAETAVIEGIVLNTERTIMGTSIYDGNNLFAVSVDFIPKEGRITVYGYNITQSADCSKFCRILSIERRA